MLALWRVCCWVGCLGFGFGFFDVVLGVWCFGCGVWSYRLLGLNIGFGKI